jgi:hypothetical protein
MFSHIMIGARDLKPMIAFYDAVLTPLHLERVVELEDIDEAGVIWRKRDRRWPQLALRRPINGLSATWGNGVQISFAAMSREVVDLAWAIAIREGALDEGAPGVRRRYAEDFYAAYCIDPEGNKLGFVHAQGVQPDCRPVTQCPLGRQSPGDPMRVKRSFVGHSPRQP